jgi:hypothetical protein
MVAGVLCFVRLPTTTTLIKKTVHVVRLRLHYMMCLGPIRVICWNAIYSFSPSYERATHHIYIHKIWTLSLLWLESGHLNSRSVVICQPGFCAIHTLFPTHWPACSRICLNISFKGTWIWRHQNQLLSKWWGGLGEEEMIFTWGWSCQPPRVYTLVQGAGTLNKCLFEQLIDFEDFMLKNLKIFRNILKRFSTLPSQQQQQKFFGNSLFFWVEIFNIPDNNGSCQRYCR